MGSGSQGTAVTLAEALGPLLPGKEEWWSHCGLAGLWAGSPGVLTNVDGVLGGRLAVARGLAPGAPGRQGRVSLSPLGGFFPARASREEEGRPPGRGGGVPRVDLVEHGLQERDSH